MCWLTTTTLGAPPVSGCIFIFWAKLDTPFSLWQNRRILSRHYKCRDSIFTKNMTCKSSSLPEQQHVSKYQIWILIFIVRQPLHWSHGWRCSTSKEGCVRTILIVSPCTFCIQGAAHGIILYNWEIYCSCRTSFYLWKSTAFIMDYCTIRSLVCNIYILFNKRFVLRHLHQRWTNVSNSHRFLLRRRSISC